MERYIKNGRIRPRNRIVIVKDGMQTVNPPHEMLIEDGWEVYETLADEELQVRKEINSAKRELGATDYKVIKCMEAFLCGEALPYDIAELHQSRDEQRRRINELEG